MATIKTLTTKDLQASFGVGHMTIWNWRQGTPTKTALPHTISDTGRVSYKPADVKAWAKQHALKFTATAVPATESKPGPKPKLMKTGKVKASAKKAPKSGKRSVSAT